MRRSLNKDRVEILNKIRMLWTVREQDRWLKYYAAAETYAKEFSHLCVTDAYVNPGDVKLEKRLITLKLQCGRGG